MISPELEKFGLVFENTTKFLICSKTVKTNTNESLIQYVLARAGFLVDDLFFLNLDSVLVRVNCSRFSQIYGLPAEFTDGPFKIRRVFKSGQFGEKANVDSLFGKAAVNFIRLLDFKRKESVKKEHLIPKINISIDSDRQSYKKLFFQYCARELDLDSAKYKGMDLAPRGEVQFNIQHFDLPKNRIQIVTWASGKYWTN